MAIEVDFLSVGDGERSGDAICVRFGNLQSTRNEQTVCVIDGGTKESGEKLVEHIRRYYNTDHVRNMLFRENIDPKAKDFLSKFLSGK